MKSRFPEKYAKAAAISNLDFESRRPSPGGMEDNLAVNLIQKMTLNQDIKRVGDLSFASGIEPAPKMSNSEK